MKKAKNPGALIALSLVFLFNPNINILDLLPDFVAYLALISAIGSASEHVPYLQECKEALSKLAIISAVKIPAMLIMFSNMYTGRDIVPLFTLIFGVVEIIFLIPAINNGYAALCYLGERTDATSLISAFPIDRSGARTMKTDALRALTLIFFSAKAALGFLPEICLLTFEDYATRKKANDIYPTLLVLSLLAVLIIGLVWLGRTKKYLNTVRKNGQVGTSVSSLIPDSDAESISAKDKVRKYSRALTTLAVASLFTFDIVFSDLGNTNILPHFIYAIVLLYAIYGLTNGKKDRYALIISTLVFVIISLVTGSVTSNFFAKYTYTDIYYLTHAAEAYAPIKILSTLEAVSMLSFIIVAGWIFIRFIRYEICGINTESLGRMAADRMKNLSLKAIILFSLTALISVLKCVNVYLKGEVIISFSESSLNPLTYSPLPWLPTVITAISALLVFYSFYFTAELKNEIKFKYSLD